jgi:hypothetical protein
MREGDTTMRAPVNARPERPARGPQARIDPAGHVPAGRGPQGRAAAAAIGAAWHAIRRGLNGLAGLAERYVLAPMLGRSERRRALTELAAMDDRLLADIGLRRGDIELAVDGRLDDPRITPRAPAPIAAGAVLAGERGPASAVAANNDRALARPDRAPDLAA